MGDKPTSLGRPPATPTSSVRAIVNWLEKEKLGDSDAEREAGSGSGNGRGRGRGRGGLLKRFSAGRSTPLTSPSPASPTATSSTTLPATPSPRWPPSNSAQPKASVAATATPPPSAEKSRDIASIATKLPEKTAFASVTSSQPTRPPHPPVERTLFPRSASPVEQASASSSFTAVSTTPVQQGSTHVKAKYQQDGSPLPPLLPQNTPTSPTVLPMILPDILVAHISTPHTPTTASPYATIYTPEDYSLEIPPYPVDSDLPATTRIVDSGSQTEERGAGRSDDKIGRDNTRDKGDTISTNGDDGASAGTAQDERKDGVAGNAHKGITYPYYRDPRDVAAFWDPVRQYLFITDEELYDS